MKNILSVIALLISVNSFGQTSFLPPVKTYGAYELGGLLVNTANAYKNPVADTITTSSSAATVYLYTAQYNTTTGGALFAVSGTGTISFTVSATKLSGTMPAATYVLLQGSNDGIQYGPVHTGAIITADSMFVANVTTQSYAWSIDTKKFRFYRLAIIIPSGTQSSLWSGQWYFNKQYLYTSGR